EIGACAQPTKWLSFGVSYAHAQEFGDATFRADRLLIRDMAMGRIDFDLGPTKISLLEKRDFDRDRWYHEYMATQVMGCLEFSIISRDFPRSRHIGLSLRLDEFIDVLKKRREQFSGQPPATPP